MRATAVRHIRRTACTTARSAGRGWRLRSARPDRGAQFPRAASAISRMARPPIVWNVTDDRETFSACRTQCRAERLALLGDGSADRIDVRVLEVDLVAPLTWQRRICFVVGRRIKERRVVVADARRALRRLAVQRQPRPLLRLSLIHI